MNELGILRLIYTTYTRRNVCRVLLVSLLFSTQLIYSQEIQVSVDTNRALIGEQIRMSLMIKADKETQIKWPLIGDTLNGLEVLKRSHRDTFTDPFGFVYRQDFLVTAFDSGVYKIDSVELLFQRGSLVDSIFAYPVFLGYGTIQLDSTNRIYDIKKPLNIEYSYWFEILMGVLGALLLIALIWYLYKRRKPVEKKTIKIKIPGHKTALKKLHEMQDQKAWLSMTIKNYYVELTDVLRVYLHEQFDINALESTSDEIMEDISVINLDDKIKNELRHLLQMSDLVKFAKAHPLPEEGESFLTIALNFVNETKPNKKEKEKEKELDKEINNDKEDA